MLREAFNKTMEDKEFLADLEKRKFDLDPSSGEESLISIAINSDLSHVSSGGSSKI